MRKERNMDAKLKGRMKTLGLNIAYQRKRKGLTQEQLAEKIEGSLSYLGKVEACSDSDDRVPTLDYLFKIVDALGISIHDLVSDE